VAHGSTAASTSLLQYEIDVPLHQLARKLGWDHAAASYLRSARAVAQIGELVRKLRLDCGFEPKSSLFLASRATHVAGLRAEFAARQKAGLSVKWRSRAQLAQTTDWPHHAGILSDCGAQIDAYRLTYGLLAAAARRGARIYDRTEVSQTLRRPRSVELVLANRRRIRARSVVLASGYEADALLPSALTALHSTYAIVSEPVDSFPGWPHERCLIWETADPYTYLRTTADGRILVGGADEKFRDPARRDRLLETKARLLERRFHRWFPRIKFQRSCAWAGTFASTLDGLPFIGPHPRIPHTFFALGYGGNGVTYSLIAARLIRDLILGRRSPDAALFGFGRPGVIL
jgi:glycine/D-amino acid oxidase-like deaminating enzyme